MKRIAGATAIVVLAFPAGVLAVAGFADADSVNWEAVAKCESSGNWAANTGNGAYGGLQIEPATWDANGGVGLPSQASPQQQIAVAQRILAAEGPKAWPTCFSRGVTAGAPAANPTGAPDGVPAAAPQTAGGPPVGSLTHFLTLLVDDAEAGDT